MSCKDLNGIISIDGCGNLSLSGIKNVWMFPFDDISEYIYDTSNLNKIVGYSASVLPALYKPLKNSSEYKGIRLNTEFDLYNHELILSFGKMEYSKREELKKLQTMELTIIFEDYNGLCWIMGQEFPVQLDNVSVNSGVVITGGNGYEMVFRSSEKQHLMEIDCPSEDCFASFSAMETRLSTIIITDASLLDWSNLLLGSDSLTIPFIPSVPIDPVNWNDPVIYNRDYTVLENLFMSFGTLESFTLSYTSDIVTIVAQSVDTSFGFLQVSGVNYNSVISINLNFKTILSPSVFNPSTLIQLNDSLGVVYSLPIGSILSGSGLSGVAEDCNIDASLLYPNGTNFTYTLPTLSCSDIEYEYLYEPYLKGCGLSVDFEFVKGGYCILDIPYVLFDINTPKFQNMEFNINGDIFTLYKNQADWHNNIIQFRNDFINLLNQVPTNINTQSIIMLDKITYVQILFNTTSNLNELINPFFNSIVYGFSLPNKVVTREGWKQSRVLNLSTIGPFPSIITHTETSLAGNNISGENGINILSNNGFLLSDTQTSNNSTIDSVGITWVLQGNEYSESDEIITHSDSPGCFTPDVTSDLISCYNGFTQTTDDFISVITLNVGLNKVLGNSFKLVSTTGTFTFNLFGNVTPTTNFHLLTNEINQIKGLNVIHMDYSDVLDTYRIYIKNDNTNNLLSLEETTNNRFFNLGSLSFIQKNVFDNNINPTLDVGWEYQWNSESAQQIPNRRLSHGHFYLNEITNEITNGVFQSGSDSLDFYKLSTIGDLVINLHEEYPTQSNSFLTDTVLYGSSNLSISGVSSKLISNGSTLSKINFLSITNSIGIVYILQVDLLTTFEFQFLETIREPRAWGTLDRLEINTKDGGTILGIPSVISLRCP